MSSASVTESSSGSKPAADALGQERNAPAAGPGCQSRPSLRPAQGGMQAESGMKQKIPGTYQLRSLWFVAQAGLELAL